MMEAPDPFNSWEELAEMILKLESRIVELEDQVGSLRRTTYGIPKGDAGDRQFTKSTPEFEPVGFDHLDVELETQQGEGRRSE